MARNPAVLVIDQDPEARFQVQQLVRQTAFEAEHQAGLGTEAVSLATDARPDVILCGLKEPLPRALQTIESLVHALPETPVIAYSEAGELGLVREAMRAGARDFLQAPFKPEELGRAIAAALESEERRRLRDSGDAVPGPHGAIITVFGAKGGVGKTTVATNLAVGLVRRGGQTAVLVDADDTFGDAAASLALPKEHTVTDALRAFDSDSGEDVRRLVSYHESGLAVLAAPASPFEWSGFSSDQLRDLLQQLARQFDVVVVDTASNLGEVSLAALRAASRVLWVTAPEYASIQDSLEAMQALRSVPLRDDHLGVVLNIASSEIDIHPDSIEQALARPIFWTVPYDRQLRRSSQLGQALVDLHPLSPAAVSLIDLALVLAGAPPERHGDGILRRLFAGRDGGLLPRRVRHEEARP